ncbi:MAG: PQQ-binding-like beta-propeller repeat protein [Thermoanaerobaculales bacterium]
MAKKEQCLFIGIGGNVVAIRPSDGQEIWRQKVKSATFMTVFATGDVVLAGAGGQLFCLHGASGQILWHNQLKGLGSGLVSFAGTSPVETAAAMAAAAAAATAVMAASVAASS